MLRRKRSKQNLSNTHLTTFDMGELIPINVLHTLPDDTIQMSTSAFMRFSPLVAPVMHPVHAHIHHWYVPYEMVWDDWREFCTGFVEGDEDTASTKTMPTIDMSSGSTGDLGDYLGIPPSATAATVNALAIRAYAKIYNSHYRDQDTQDALTIDTTDGTDTTTSTAVKNVNWAKFDRFMDAATSTQKGSAVSMPLGTSAPVLGIGKTEQT